MSVTQILISIPLDEKSGLIDSEKRRLQESRRL